MISYKSLIDLLNNYFNSKIVPLQNREGGISGALHFLLPAGKRHVKVVMKQAKKIGDFLNHKNITKNIKSNKIFNKKYPTQTSIPIIDYAFIHKKEINKTEKNCIGVLLVQKNVVLDNSILYDLKNKVKNDIKFIKNGIRLHIPKKVSLLEKDLNVLKKHNLVDYSLFLSFQEKALSIDCKNNKLNISNKKKLEKDIWNSFKNNKQLRNNKLLDSLDYDYKPWSKKDIDMLIELNYPSPILPKQLKKDIIKEWSATKDIKKYYKDVCDSAITITFKDSMYSSISIIDITYFYNLYGFNTIINIKLKKNKKTTRCRNKKYNECNPASTVMCSAEKYNRRLLKFIKTISKPLSELKYNHYCVN